MNKKRSGPLSMPATLAVAVFLAAFTFFAIFVPAYAATTQGAETGASSAKTDKGAAPAKHAKRPRPRSTTRWHGYGFLPGYRTPERLAWERARSRGPVYWYGYPRFYRGRWNGGGFGPCWTPTPIGPHWNCG